jgi:ketosteroid isomerase-like protein
MTTYHSAADAEDAYYDAIDEGDLEKMMGTWEASDEICCLLPMQAMQHGTAAVRQQWAPMLGSGMQVDITINHIRWIEMGDISIHLVEEMVTLPQTGERQPPIYATNLYRQGELGWKLVMHLNSPTPPPPGFAPPGFS